MQPMYSATIAVKTKGIVDLEFARPLELSTVTKIKALASYEGVSVSIVPQLLGLSGFWIMHSEVWEGTTVAKECLKLLKEEGFEESKILSIGFTES